MTEKSSALDRLTKMKKAQEEKVTETDLVSQLTHETDAEPDFAEIAKKLEERKAQEAKGENFEHVKMTIYIEQSIADSFNALCTKRGDQKAYANQALRDFVAKKAKELGI